MYKSFKHYFDIMKLNKAMKGGLYIKKMMNSKQAKHTKSWKYIYSSITDMKFVYLVKIHYTDDQFLYLPKSDGVIESTRVY